MVFLSCRIVFPADTCTVTVLMPSRENVHATLPSRVITGCWGRKRETRREGRGGSQSEVVPVRDPDQRLVSHCCYLHYRGVSLLLAHSHTHTHTHTLGNVCAVLHTVSGPTESSLCDSGSSFLSLLTSPFVLQIAIRC